jgi:hypothetical protein
LRIGRSKKLSFTRRPLSLPRSLWQECSAQDKPIVAVSEILEKLVVDELLRAAVPCDDDDRKIAYFVLHIFMTGQERAAGIGWR